MRTRRASKSDSLRSRRSLIAAALAGLLSACVYRVDVQQGNLLDQQDIDAVQIGMSRSQVRFLLGTPMVEDPFSRDRWDYMYYFQRGRARRPEQRWLIVYFEGDRVREIQRDVPISRAG